MAAIPIHQPHGIGLSGLRRAGTAPARQHPRHRVGHRVGHLIFRPRGRPATASASTPPAGTAHHVDGLDGMRGLAVLAVLLFHLWPSLLPGGFIGVTVFFALSGYLITSLLLRELEGTGTLSLRRFYGRRFRRLVPASLLTVTVVAVGWSLAGWFTPDLRRDVWYAAGQAANWGHVVAEQRYGVDATASPLLHFWSLAIEEQLYLLLPLTLLLCRTRRRARIVVGLALAGSVVAVVATAGDPTWTYYSTLARGGEVLVGSLAALVLHDHRWRRTGRVVAVAVAALGLAALAWVARTTGVGDPAVSHGALLGTAAAATVVIVAVAGWPASGRRVDWGPLARLGQISYAVYLFHWPLLQTLRRTSLDPRLVPWTTLSATLLLALASERWFERPIREGRVPAHRLAVLGAPVLVLLPVVSALGVIRPAGVVDFEAASEQFDRVIADAQPASSAPAPRGAGRVDVPGAGADGGALPAAARPVVVGFFGDSKALTLGLGTAKAGFDDLRTGTSFTPLGCPVGRGGTVRQGAGAPVNPLPAGCDWGTGVAASALRSGGIDVAVVWSGTWDVADRTVPALGPGWWSVDDAEYREWLLGEMVAYTDAITSATGASTVLWLTVPPDPAVPYHDRFDVWTWLLGELQVERPKAVRVVDVASWLASTGDATRILPDGVHVTAGDDAAHNTAAELTRALLVPLFTTAPRT